MVAYERHAEKHLGAYRVPRRYPPPAVSDFWPAVSKRRLPDYMVPSVFLMLKAFTLDSKRQARPRRATGTG